MAKADQLTKGKVLLPVGGMDESIQVVESDVTFASVDGAGPFYLATLQRLFGKKLIDRNREQPVMGLAQAFNSFGQYGYYVQSQHKLYYHLCEAPTDFHINFTTPTTLGIDSSESNRTLDAFGRSEDGSVLPAVDIPCVFGFPDRPDDIDPDPDPDPEPETSTSGLFQFTLRLNSLPSDTIISLVEAIDPTWAWDIGLRINPDTSEWNFTVHDYFHAENEFYFIPIAVEVDVDYVFEIDFRALVDDTLRLHWDINGTTGVVDETFLQPTSTPPTVADFGGFGFLQFGLFSETPMMDLLVDNVSVGITTPGDVLTADFTTDLTPFTDAFIPFADDIIEIVDGRARLFADGVDPTFCYIYWYGE